MSDAALESTLMQFALPWAAVHEVCHGLRACAVDVCRVM